MSTERDLDDVLADWDYRPGELSARIISAANGREVIQVRVDLGVLQLETEGRPDGWRPGGAESYYDYLVALALQEGDAFRLNDEQQVEVDREFLQFYQRRICWLTLQRWEAAVDDADHNLALLDFIGRCSPSDEWLQAHEQYRPFILFHRTEASALSALAATGPEAAIDQVNQGLQMLQEVFVSHEAEELFEENDMVHRLRVLREALREEHGVGSTLEEQLRDAVAREQYELAAQLRDQINRRDDPPQ
jgi:hypothetical protein